MGKGLGWLVIFFLVLNLVSPLPTRAEEPANTAEMADNLDFSEIEEYVEQVDQEIQEHLPELSISRLYQDLKKGDFSWNVKDLVTGLLRFFFQEVVANSGLLTKLVILAVASVVLANLQSAFDQGNIAILGHGVIYLVLISIVLNSFSIAVNTGKEAIDSMTGFLYALMPLLLSLLAAMGNVTSAALIHPAMVMMLGFSTTVIKTLIFPFIYFMAVLNIVSHISPQFKVTRLAGLFKDLSLGFLGILMTIFVGFLGMQGLAGSVADGLTIKAAKFATGAFIPVVGKSLADAMDTVIGTSLILKNGIGFLGVVVIFLLCAIPAIKIIAMSLIYRIVAAIIQPFGDNQLAEALHTMANSLLLVFAAVASIGLMFFFIITITIGSGNISMMFR
ncbi:stage III sporulation protein AE [Candidatus Formimonas warabiya]|uniref:Stage III sporulation protein AE n=1 Tax=Formimonas warabiya TaxID=1761012 RepID=A0A3G1KNM2_FORW1|nr:stage III sporulation protein AE [Candidatus Formimonas warabiya]ATW24026.1 stage III sporulation protein AE [Candidatus Formimonas warabiya]